MIGFSKSERTGKRSSPCAALSWLTPLLIISISTSTPCAADDKRTPGGDDPAERNAQETTILLRPDDATMKGDWMVRGTEHVALGRVAEVSTLRWQPDLPRASFYRVSLSYTPSESNASNAAVTIRHAFSLDTLVIDQRSTPKRPEPGFELGVFYFNSGERSSIELSNAGADGDVTVGTLRLDAVAADAVVPPRDPNEPRFHLPSGFKIEPAALPPLTQYPMLAHLTNDGRLFLAESDGTNAHGPEAIDAPRNFVRLLHDDDGDGRYDRGSVFAAKLSLPMGVLWHQEALYVAAAPDLWRFTDEDRDGHAERREAIVSGFNLRNTASLHGPFLGPCGRLYLTHGRHGHELDFGDGRRVKGLASGIYRLQPDGSELERVGGGGFDNPVEVAFSRTGQMFLTMTYITNPRNGERDAMLHLVEGGVYPKLHSSTAEFLWTGRLLPPMTIWGRVAPAGVVRYRGEQFGAEYRGRLFTAHFNPHKVTWHDVRRHGSTYLIDNHDFLSSADPDFHPTDVLEDADGSLLIVDTGGWYIHACPLSRVAKPEVKGGVWRVRRRDATTGRDPRGKEIAWQALAPSRLVALLGDPRPVVRDRARDALTQHGAAALTTALRDGSDPEIRRRALWALARIESDAARDALALGIADPEVEVRLAALRAVATLRCSSATDAVTGALGDADPGVRRQAAEALGRISLPRSESLAIIPQLLDLLHGETDAFVEHTVIHTLIQMVVGHVELREHLSPYLRDEHAGVRRAALVALDQSGAQLAVEDVFACLDTDNSALRAATLEVVGRHPEWSMELARHLKGWLGVSDATTKKPQSLAPGVESAALRGALRAFANEDEVRDVIGSALMEEGTSEEALGTLLETLASAHVPSLPDSWRTGISRALTHSSIAVRLQAIDLIRMQRLDGFDAALIQLSRRNRERLDVRFSALRACASRLAVLDDELFDLLVSHVGVEADPFVKLKAAAALGQMGVLSKPQLLRLADAVTEGDALVASQLLHAFGSSSDAAVGSALLLALRTAPAATALRPSEIRRAFARFPEDVQRAASTLAQRSTTAAALDEARLVALRPLLDGGDAARGRELFYGRAACSACHRVGQEGGTLGPDLTEIGRVRAGRDLLEAVVFPSASFAQGYETYAIVTTDGEVISGVVSAEDAESMTLRGADLSRVRIERHEVAAMERQSASLMPQGLDQLLKRDEMRHLLAYLKSLRGSF